MMGERRAAQEHLFYEFSLERHVPETHLLRSIDRFVELGGLRRELAPFYSEMGRPSIDPELLIRMLIVGYCFGIRSERRLCEEVHLNLAYRWFCRLGLDGSVPDHSSFSKNRHGRFRDSDLLRRLFETVLQRCIDEGLVGGEGFAVDADNAIIVDVEATTAIRQAEILAAKRMIERSLEHFDLDHERLIGDITYGSAEMLNWLVHDRGIEPHIPVFDKSQRTDGTFSREDFTYDHASDAYRCPAGKTLQHYRRQFTTPRTGVMKDNSIRYRASKRDCEACPLKPHCCPNAPARKITRSIYEGARGPGSRDRQDRRVPDLAPPAQKGRDAVRSPQAHSEARSAPTTRAERRPRRVPPRRDRSEPPQTRQADPDAVAALSDVRQQFLLDLGHSPTPGCRNHSKTDFFNGIGQNRKPS